MKSLFSCLTTIAFLSQQALGAISLDLTSPDSMRNAAKQAAAGMVQYYTGNKPGDVPGNLPEPYYWWNCGAMMGALIDYWYFTGDDTYNKMVMQAMVHQLGPDKVYQPANQTRTLGNDDQAFWAMAALSAAENLFPEPPESAEASWLGAVQGVFNLQAHRWNTETCGGGLKWQIFSFNAGYNYKNSISNGCFFNIASRLAVYTLNDTYAQHANKVWDWSTKVLIDEKYNIYDGADDRMNCTELDHIQWTYNAGTYLVGAANMYNYTNGSALWEERIRGIIGNLHLFQKDGVVWEAACEDVNTCNVDQRSFKAYFARWLAMTIIKAPFTRPLLKPILETSAQAAVMTCTGGSDGNQCGLRWQNRAFDGSTGVNEQMAVLEVVQSNLVDYVDGPATLANGLSRPDPNAGTHTPVGPEDLHSKPITGADRAGGAIFTIIVIVSVIGTAVWLVMGE